MHVMFLHFMACHVFAFYGMSRFCILWHVTFLHFMACHVFAFYGMSRFCILWHVMFLHFMVCHNFGGHRKSMLFLLDGSARPLCSFCGSSVVDVTTVPAGHRLLFWVCGALRPAGQHVHCDCDYG